MPKPGENMVTLSNKQVVVETMFAATIGAYAAIAYYHYTDEKHKHLNSKERKQRHRDHAKYLSLPLVGIIAVAVYLVAKE